MKTERSAVIVLLLRCFLGFALFLPLGIDKIAGFPGSSVEIVEKHRETILGVAPVLPLLYLFSYVLPLVETLGGLALLVGWQTRRAFLVMGCLLVVIGFGTTLGHRVGSTANALVFLASCLWGYLLADADRYGISAWRRSGRGT
jgi:uncharacterized membrane protein YphA (DoxX/SURF4 family)